MLNVEIIDHQHKELLDRLNRLNEAVKNRELRENIYRLIDDVILFTRGHFATEEQFMAKSGYVGTEWHLDKHKELIQEAMHLKAKLDYVGEQMFTEWFNHWPFANVLAHIQYADKQVEDHINRSDVVNNPE